MPWKHSEQASIATGGGRQRRGASWNEVFPLGRLEIGWLSWWEKKPLKKLRAAPPLQLYWTVSGVLCLWLHKPFIEALLRLSCQANPLGWSAPLIPRQENGTEDINQDYYTGPCSSQASGSYHKITSWRTIQKKNEKKNYSLQKTLPKAEQI